MGIGPLLLVLVLAGSAFLLYVCTIGRAKHGEEIVQAENDLAELRASNPEYNFESYELDDGAIKFVHNEIDATAFFDYDNKLLHLKSEKLGDRTETPIELTNRLSPRRWHNFAKAPSKEN